MFDTNGWYQNHWPCLTPLDSWESNKVHNHAIMCHVFLLNPLLMFLFLVWVDKLNLQREKSFYFTGEHTNLPFKTKPEIYLVFAGRTLQKVSHLGANSRNNFSELKTRSAGKFGFLSESRLKHQRRRKIRANERA